MLQLLASGEEHSSISAIIIVIIERVSIESRKTKTKVITLADQKGRRQSKPIKT